MEQLAEEKIPLTKELIDEIYDTILPADLFQNGAYRLNIPGRFIDPEIGGLFMPTRNTEYGLENLLRPFTDPTAYFHPIEQIAMFFLGFESLFPYNNTPWYMSLLLLNFMLIQEEYPPIYFKAEDMVKYRISYNEYSENGNPLLFIRLICEHLQETLEANIPQW